jgi:curved DNA-binding protein CbpA
MALIDPYKVLGIPHSATDVEIRAAYRRQVQLHHPDHNGGSPESARRFEQVQEAYALIIKLDRVAPSTASTASSRPAADSPPSDPGLAQRLADLEREVAAQRAAKRDAARRAQRIREDALRQAREAARPTGDRASDDDLGYVSSDDSFSAILDDAAAAWSERLAGSTPDGRRDPTPGAPRDSAPEHEPVTERLADLFDDLGSRLRGEKSKGDRRRSDED